MTFTQQKKEKANYEASLIAWNKLWRLIAERVTEKEKEKLSPNIEKAPDAANARRF